MDPELYDKDPRAYALEIIRDYISAHALLRAALRTMTTEQVRQMLDDIALSLRNLYLGEELE